MREGRPNAGVRPRVAVVGAGVSGLACARALSFLCDVVLYDKSRGVGGRMSTRYAGDYEFDHGAQFFTVREASFAKLVDTAVAEGVVGRWQGRFLYLSDESVTADTGGERFVGVPRMNSFPKWLAAPLRVETGCRVAAIRPGDRLQLEFEDDGMEAGFDAVVVAVPAPQAVELLPHGFAQRDRVASAEMEPCFTLMVGLEERPHPDMRPDMATLRAKGLPVDWIALNSSKPGRPARPATLVIQAEAGWSRACVDAPRETVARELGEVASALLGLPLHAAPHRVLHRWLYSSVARGANAPFLWDADMKIGVCGDWCEGGRVEGAWTSGHRLGETLERELV